MTKKFTEHAEIVSKGKTITRNGDEENPAYKVERPGKNPVLKKVGVPEIQAGLTGCFRLFDL